MLRSMSADVAEARRRDLLQTLVGVGILLTPAWLTPSWFGRPWAVAVILLVAVPNLYLTWRHAPWVATPERDMARILAEGPPPLGGERT